MESLNQVKMVNPWFLRLNKWVLNVKVSFQATLVEDFA